MGEALRDKPLLVGVRLRASTAHKSVQAKRITWSRVGDVAGSVAFDDGVEAESVCDVVKRHRLLLQSPTPGCVALRAV